VTTTTTPAKVAFVILSDDPARTLPGLVMTARMKVARGADEPVLFCDRHATGSQWRG